MLLYSLLDSFLELASFKQGRSIRNTGNGLVGLEHHAGHAHIELLACLEVEAQTAHHDGNQTAGSGSDDEVKVVAWLGDFISSGCAAFCLDKGSVHKLLDDDEHGVTSDATSICMRVDSLARLAGRMKALAGVGWGSLPRDRTRRGGPFVVSFLLTP